MKKISAVLLVLVLVGSVAFAGFTGSATTGVGYNMDSGEYGFITQSTSVTVDVTLLENLGEAAGEGDIYASIKATLDFTFDNADAGTVNDVDRMIIGANLDFDHAKVFGDNWSVSILGAATAPNYATSTIDTEELGAGANALSYAYDAKDYYADLRAQDILQKAPGVEVSYADYVLSVGFKGDHKDSTEAIAPQVDETGYRAYAALTTSEMELMDGLTAQFGVAGFLRKGPLETVADGVLADDNAVSAHAKVAYEDDVMSVTLGADAIYDNAAVEVDAALAATYDIVTLDAYFATSGKYVNTDVATQHGSTFADLLSAKVAVDLDPLTVTVTGKDLINVQDLGVEVAYQVSEELLVTVNGGYILSGINAELWSAGADLEYATDSYTAALGGSYNGNDILGMSASIESEVFVPGATVKLAWSDAKDMLGNDATKTDLGKIVASVEIAF